MLGNLFRWKQECFCECQYTFEHVRAFHAESMQTVFTCTHAQSAGFAEKQCQKNTHDTSQALCPGFPFSANPPGSVFLKFLPPSITPALLFQCLSLSGSTMFYFLAEIVQHLFNQRDCTLRSNSANIKTKVFLCFIPSLNPFLLARERKRNIEGKKYVNAIIIKRVQNIS